MALNTKFESELKAAIEKLKQERVYKSLNYLASPQDARVKMEGRGEIVILSSNNYLGLCNDLIESMIDAWFSASDTTKSFCSTIVAVRPSLALHAET